MARPYSIKPKHRVQPTYEAREHTPSFLKKSAKVSRRLRRKAGRM